MSITHNDQLSNLNQTEIINELREKLQVQAAELINELRERNSNLQSLLSKSAHSKYFFSGKILIGYVK